MSPTSRRRPHTPGCGKASRRNCAGMVSGSAAGAGNGRRRSHALITGPSPSSSSNGGSRGGAGRTTTCSFGRGGAGAGRYAAVVIAVIRSSVPAGNRRRAGHVQDFAGVQEVGVGADHLAVGRVPARPVSGDLGV